jgi:DNA-binding NarL/FixJ family response regulator
MTIAEIRTKVTEMIKQGHTDSHIAYELKLNRNTVKRFRELLDK